MGLLCEADLRLNNLQTAGVTWGGNQDAKDGGLDVRVELTDSPNPAGFIPRAMTGYQVKKPDMPHSEILKEMCPNGNLRSVIRDLSEQCGAYIIVSSTGSASDLALRNRRKAMAEAVAKLNNSSNQNRGAVRLPQIVNNQYSIFNWVLRSLRWFSQKRLK